MRCEIHCPKDGGSAVAGLGTVLMLVGAAMVAYAIWQARVDIAITGATLVILTVAARKLLLRLSPALQRTGVPALRSGYLAHQLAAQHRRPRRVVPRPAVTAGQRAIESKMVTVTPDMILRQAIEEEAR